MSSKQTVEEAVAVAAEVEEEDVKVKLGCYGGFVKLIEDPSEEIMLLWGLQQPIFSKPNAFVHQSSLSLRLDAFGHSINILQSPSSLMTPGVTGSVMWDSGIVLGKFLEHAVDSEKLLLQGKKVAELGSGCGLVGCIAALSGAQVTLTDLPDRLRLLKKNVDTNLNSSDMLGSGMVSELIWGEDPDPDILDPLPNYVLGSDVIYSEEAVGDLLSTLLQLCDRHTTVILSGELRNDAILELFLESAIKDFWIGQVDQSEFHPEYSSHRVVIYILVKKDNEDCISDN
ncbi:protein N-lysine methyltransferase METTL21A-like isoform X1 [Chenopodium quinoa]|uniref:protein N-lysine methyltransferase METTL21A-like isoform X1 n=1 Tax=Chenopodium quinoa TaxID=63459 RepID=UPI000B77695D|nr:protein N-lysine methyltransferase METTL21A-like isoform X1 [Chenopodium quinoa]